MQSTITVELSTSTQVYNATCPSMQTACPHQLPSVMCPGDCNFPFGGICQRKDATYGCSCFEGWSGEACAEYTCSGTVCPPALTPAMESTGVDFMGMCTNNKCKCEEGFTGVDCRLPEPTCARDCSLLVRCIFSLIQ